MFVYTHLKKQELAQEGVYQRDESQAVPSPYAGITRIDAKQFYAAPTHTFVGEILMPTPCDLLNWDTRVLESMPETIIIDFSVVNHSEACAQVMTLQRFKVTADASEAATVRATFEGRAVDLNLIPAEPGETPDDFELFIKG
jgi:hypothetical protein